MDEGNKETEMIPQGDLTSAMDATLGGEFSSLLSDLSEAGLDAFLEDGFLREIPIISTVFSFYKIGSAIRERYLLKKFIIFLSVIDNDREDEGFRKKYSDYFAKDNHDKEVEYLLIILDRLLDADQVKLFARLYERLLEGAITFFELRLFAQIVERLLLGDYETLLVGNVVKTTRVTENESILRLIGLGLMIEAVGHVPIEQQDNGTVVIDPPELSEIEERVYRRTALGERLVELIDRSYLLEAK